MKKILTTSVLIFSLAMPVFAAGPTLADLQGALMQEDYKKVNELAKDLAKSRLPKTEAIEVQYYLGLSLLRLGDYAEAQGVFKALIAERPASEMLDRASAGLVDALYMQGQYEQALKEVTWLITRRRDSDMMGLFYLKAARANLKLARWQKAQDFLKKIQVEYPDSFESNIARQLLEEKQYFTVQVGSFTDKTRAEKLVREVIERKEYAYIVESKSNDGKVMYRVRVGQLTALKDARELESKLSGLGYPTLIYP